MSDERIYTIPLIKAKSVPRPRRANRAVKEIREFLTRHMKAEEVYIDASLNERVWERGRVNIPTRIRVKGVKGDDGVVWAYTPEAEVIAPEERKPIKKEEEVEEAPLAPIEEVAEMESAVAAEGEKALEVEAEELEAVEEIQGEPGMVEGEEPAVKSQAEEAVEVPIEKLEKPPKEPEAPAPEKPAKKSAQKPKKPAAKPKKKASPSKSQQSEEA